MLSDKLKTKALGATSTAVRLSQEQRELLAAALHIDVKFVPDELGVLGVPRGDGTPAAGIPVDRAGQFAPAMMIM